MQFGSSICLHFSWLWYLFAATNPTVGLQDSTLVRVANRRVANRAKRIAERDLSAPQPWAGAARPLQPRASIPRRARLCACTERVMIPDAHRNDCELTAARLTERSRSAASSHPASRLAPHHCHERRVRVQVRMWPALSTPCTAQPRPRQRWIRTHSPLWPVPRSRSDGAPDQRANIA